LWTGLACVAEERAWWKVRRMRWVVLHNRVHCGRGDLGHLHREKVCAWLTRVWGVC
jgi:hypothetical protein